MAQPEQMVGNLSRSCAPLNASVSVHARDVIAPRLPSIPSGWPGQCQKLAADRLRSWMQQDIDNWPRLANQACSYKLGWVEREPGECEAGGPPPICPVDHWVQRPAQAEAEWKKRLEEVRARRQAELKAMACGCWVRESERGDLSRPPGPFGYGGSVLCGGGTCPSGFTCASTTTFPSQYRCVPGGVETPIGQLLDEVQGVAVDETTEAALLRIVKEFMPRMVTLATKLAAVVGFARDLYGSLATNREAYGHAVNQYKASLEEMKRLYTALREARDLPLGSRPPVAPIIREIHRVREQIKNQAVTMNGAYAVMVRSELRSDECAEVVQYQHRAIQRSIDGVMRLPLYEEPSAPSAPLSATASAIALPDEFGGGIAARDLDRLVQLAADGTWGDFEVRLVVGRTGSPPVYETGERLKVGYRVGADASCVLLHRDESGRYTPLLRDGEALAVKASERYVFPPASEDTLEVAEPPGDEKFVAVCRRGWNIDLREISESPDDAAGVAIGVADYRVVRRR
jgi:hypothetical protein